jgi:hypothetical protein
MMRPFNQSKRVALLALLLLPMGSGIGHAAGPAMRSAGAVASARVQPGSSRGFRGPVFFGGGGFDGPTDVTVQQFQPAPAATPAEKPEGNRVYVPPRWVDGGYGVQILVPGYWSEADPARAR